MRYVSLFSGIEAASVAWSPLGWEPVAFSEVEPFCCDLLAERFPEVPNLGDITAISWKEQDLGAIDLVVGGSPCQSFSIAGGREGLDGESRLMLEYIRAVDEIHPRWLLWENVPGVFSIDEGRAFGLLLHELEKLGYGLAWRVLDAQFFGVAQRRRRVFLVGHFGGGVGAAAAVLFESESVRGNTGSSAEKRQELASRNRRGVGSPDYVMATDNSGAEIGEGFAPTLICRQAPIAFANHRAANAIEDASAPTYVLYTAYKSANGSNITTDTAYTIDTQNTQAVAAPVMLKLRHTGSSTNGKGGEGALWGEDVSFTLATSQDQTLIYGPPRRLTPLECERLQGFPDGWTDLGSDSKRYKALGNSMAVPVMRWLGERIAYVEGVIDGD